MAHQQPRSRPAPAGGRQRKLNPQPSPSVYGDQWGQSGRQNLDQTGEPDRPEPISPRQDPGKDPGKDR